MSNSAFSPAPRHEQPMGQPSAYNLPGYHGTHAKSATEVYDPYAPKDIHAIGRAVVTQSVTIKPENQKPTDPWEATDPGYGTSQQLPSAHTR